MLIKKCSFKNNSTSFLNSLNLSLIVVDYDNSFITYYMLTSFLSLPNSNLANIYVLINKQNQYIYLLEELAEKNKNINLIYNYNSILLKDYNENMNPFNRGSYNHSLSLQYLINNYVFTENVLICDNDIIFKNTFNIEYFINELNNYDIISNVIDLDYQTKYIIENYFKANTYELIDKNLNIYTYMLENKQLKIYGRFDPFCIFFKTKILKENTIIDSIDDISCLPDDYIKNTNKNNFIHCDTFGKLTTKILKNNYKIKPSTYEIYGSVRHFGNASCTGINNKDFYYNSFVLS